VENRWRQLVVCTIPPILWSVCVLAATWLADLDPKITNDFIPLSLLWVPVAVGLITNRRVKYLEPSRPCLAWMWSFAGLFAESIACLLMLACWILIPLIIVFEVL